MINENQKTDKLTWPNDDCLETNTIVAIDINETKKILAMDVAYYRITKEFRDFLKLCQEKHGVIGFEYEVDSLNFGVILGKKS